MTRAWEHPLLTSTRPLDHEAQPSPAKRKRRSKWEYLPTKREWYAEHSGDGSRLYGTGRVCKDLGITWNTLRYYMSKRRLLPAAREVTHLGEEALFFDSRDVRRHAQSVAEGRAISNSWSNGTYTN